MYYSGGDIIRIFPFNLEDEQLSSISFLCTSVPNIWNIIQSSNQAAFEDSAASHIIDHEHSCDRHGGVRQIIAIKIFFQSSGTHNSLAPCNHQNIYAT